MLDSMMPQMIQTKRGAWPLKSISPGLMLVPLSHESKPYSETRASRL